MKCNKQKKDNHNYNDKLKKKLFYIKTFRFLVYFISLSSSFKLII